jgi:PAS domain S-box-containing protein
VHTVVVIGGTALDRHAVVDAFARANVLATPAEHLDPGVRPHLLVITGFDAYALVREARSAPHLTEVPILVVLPDGDLDISGAVARLERPGTEGAVVEGAVVEGAVVELDALEPSGPVQEVAEDAVEEIVEDTSSRMPLPAARAQAGARARPLVAEPMGSLVADEADEVTNEVTNETADDAADEVTDEATGEHARAATAPALSSAMVATMSEALAGSAAASLPGSGPSRAPFDPVVLVDALLDAGANDVVRSPIPPRLLRNRAEMLLTVSRRVDLAAIPSELLRVNDVLTQHGDDAEALVNVLEVIRDALEFERASLIAYIEGSDHGFMIAATDAPTRRQFTLAMAEYPEISHAMKSGAPVLIDDVMTHPLTMRLGDMLADRGVRGSAVLPVQWRGRLLGVILLRRSTPGVGHIVGRGMELAQLITSITAAHLRHGPVLASLREQTHRISRDRYEAERRLRGIDSLKEHFEAGTDGVVVLDNGGRILFVNRAAERITGFARDGLIGSLLTDLAPFEQRAQIEDAAAQVLSSTNVAPFDLSLNTTQHTPVRVSVSTSTVLAGTGAAIFSFRDVTAERKLENELRSTKEFLERLIDSTVDAIIAADLHGTIILFNQGAERLFGFRAEDMIGKRPIWDLYDKTAARQIMRMLRSNAYGGGGRLDATRREVKSRSGELVPVSMTAAIIYEGVDEVATVGILTDLRERIRMEQRLAQAQRQLQLTEKQALVAELAGAAAHELNQPLTSILGYCELLKRQGPPEAPHMRAVSIISGQSERMAAIIKKIGRLTKYETTEYINDERIIDIYRATDDSGLVVDPVEEGQTGEFTAVLPGGLAQALHREDFDLVWPRSSAPDASPPGVPPLPTEPRAEESEPTSPGTAGVAGISAGVTTKISSGLHETAPDPARLAGSPSGPMSPMVSSVLSPAGGVAPAVLSAFGSGPSTTPSGQAVPSEINEGASTGLRIAAAAAAAAQLASAAPETELVVDDTKPRGK